jgi:hypothetical protein
MDVEHINAIGNLLADLTKRTVARLLETFLSESRPPRIAPS